MKEEQEDKNAKQDKVPAEEEVKAGKQITEKSEEEIHEEMIHRKFSGLLFLLDSTSLLYIALTYLYDESDLIEIMDSEIKSHIKEKILKDYERRNEVTTDKKVTENYEEEIHDEMIDQKFIEFLSLLESDELIYVALTYFYEVGNLIEILDYSISTEAKEKILQAHEKDDLFQ